MPKILNGLKRIPLLAVLATGAFLPAVTFADGADTFSKNCASCHGQDAKGMDYVAPSLVGSEWLASASAEDIKALVRSGRQGADKRFPKKYPAAMPPFTESQISAEDLDALVSYLKGPLQE